MTRERNALKAGLFIVASIIGIIVAIVLIHGQTIGPSQLRTVTFTLDDDVSGLSSGDDVRLGGTKVGTVRDIRIETPSSGPSRMVVSFAVPTRYVFREGAKVGIQAQLTGPPNLNITSLGAGQTLAENAEIIGSPDIKAALFASLGTMAGDVQAHTLPKLNQAVEATDTLVRHVNSKIDPIVGQYDVVAHRAADMMSEVRDILGDSKLDIRQMVKNLNLAIASIKDKLPPILDKVTALSDKVDGVLGSARNSLADVEKTAANAKEMSASVRSLLADNYSKIDLMVKSLKTASDNLKSATIEIRHSPWRLLYKPTPGEMGNLNLFDSARQFADGASSLDDAAAALRDALKDPNVDKQQLKKLLDHLDDTFAGFKAAEDKLRSSVKQ